MDDTPLFRLEALSPAVCGQGPAGAAGGGDSGVRLLTLDNTEASARQAGLQQGCVSRAA